MPKTFEQRPYQQRIISQAANNWRDGVKSQLIESPPGSGKTVMGFSICKDIIENAQELFGIGWVAMRRNLLKQAAEENEAMIGCPNVHTISMFDSHVDENPLMDYKHRVLVIDEAHHDATNSCATIHNIVAPDLVLGLSATPIRTDRVKLCFEVTLKDAGFHTLIQDGYLSEFDQWMLDDWKPESVARAYLAEPDKWGKSIMYFLKREECHECEAILKANGVRCDVVTGETDRFQQIEDLEEGRVDVLINMFVLTEGFDYPELQTVFVRDSANKGPSVQMSGRVLRKHEDIPVKNIVQSVQTHFPFTRVARAHQQYVMIDGHWRSIGINEMVRMMSKQMIHRVIKAEVDVESLRALRASGSRNRRRNL
jgi:superfamily II DNA or RNA helicase